jgi:AraC-like DNA-binding protein
MIGLRLPALAGLEAALACFDVAGVAIGLFAALRLLRRGRGGAKADRLLALLVLLFTANVAHGAIDPHARLEVSLLLEPLQFLLPLGVAWHLRALRGKRILEPPDILYFILALAFVFASYAPGLLAPRLPSGVPIFSLVMWLAISVSSIFLLIPIARDLHRYRTELEGRFSNLEGLDPGWLRGLLILTGGLFAVYVLVAVILIHAPIGFGFRPLLAALMSSLTLYLSWKGLDSRSPSAIAPGFGHASEAAMAELEAPGEEENAGHAARARELIAAIERERLFLEPELRLDDLARAAGTSRHKASEAINKGLGASFFDLVNGYRVEEFKRLCVDEARRSDKIMTLALESGFNSKPSFNLVFKKMTGMTPSQYRSSAEIESRPIA